MNCWILVLLLLCCGNNTGWSGGNCGCGSNCGNGCRDRSERRECGNDGGGCGRDNNNYGSDRCQYNSGNCGNERPDNDCDCRNDFRPEPRFESRPFTFNQSDMCGCEEPQNNNNGQ